MRYSTEDMVKLYNDGKSLSEISDIVHKHSSTVARCLRSAGVKMRGRGQQEGRYKISHETALEMWLDICDGMSKAEAAKKHRINHGTVNILIERYGFGRPWNSGADTKVVDKRAYPPGTTHLIDRFPYRVNERGLVFYWDAEFSEWVRNTMTVDDLESGGVRTVTT